MTKTHDFGNAKSPRIILGSASPRRRELLAQVCSSGLNVGFEVIKPEVDEVPRQGELPADYAQRNAREKGQFIWNKIRMTAGETRQIVISADTIVVLDQKILEKPVDAADAFRMLGLLSGQTHQVMTGLYLQGTDTKGREIVRERLVKTAVTFRTLSSVEIDSYILSGEPFDKAGGYAAQGIGSYMIAAINGSYTNVVGLPMVELLDSLENDFECKFW